MARRWERTFVSGFCGACGRQIEKGEVVQRIALPDVKRCLTRCFLCGDERAPDLPPLPHRKSIFEPFVFDDRPMSKVDVRDWKTRVFGK